MAAADWSLQAAPPAGTCRKPDSQPQPPAETYAPVPSDYYTLCFDAILGKKQIVFTYRDRRREVCPHVLGFTKGREMLLGYQFAGETNGVLPQGGEWRCFQVAEMHSIEMRHGDWHTGGSHSQAHSCVGEVDLDVNSNAPQRSWARHLPKD